MAFPGMKPRERYFTDPTFKAMVDQMTSHMLTADYTPSEMREAALMASIKYYEMRPQGLVVNADGLHELMRKLEENYPNKGEYKMELTPAEIATEITKTRARLMELYELQGPLPMEKPSETRVRLFDNPRYTHKKGELE